MGYLRCFEIIFQPRKRIEQTLPQRTYIQILPFTITFDYYKHCTFHKEDFLKTCKQENRVLPSHHASTTEPILTSNIDKNTILGKYHFSSKYNQQHEHVLHRQYDSLERLTVMYDEHFSSDFSVLEATGNCQRKHLSVYSKSSLSVTSSRSEESFPVRNQRVQKRCLPLKPNEWGENLSWIDQSNCSLEFFRQGSGSIAVREISSHTGKPRAKKRTFRNSLKSYRDFASGLTERRRLAKEWRAILGNSSDPRPWSITFKRERSRRPEKSLITHCR